MLIFFIHGVATQDAKYAQLLENLIREEFKKRGKPSPCFYASFWGHFLRDVGKMWDWIEQDLHEFQKEHPQTDPHDLFRYQKFRKDFLFEFFGDAFTYLNSERGVEIRKLITDRLEDFIKQNPKDTELHIVSHSLGTVILWDILFSDKFKPDDPGFKIRAMIEGLSSSNADKQVRLSSITTMGSPILLFNMMLDTKPETVKLFADTYPKDTPLRWMNIIHSSDIIAYPLRSSLNLNSSDTLFLRDEYISTDANLAEKAARAVGQVDAAMAIGVADAHVGYWQYQQTARLITDNILRDNSNIRKVITRLSKVPGMTPDNNTHVGGEVVSFRDGSGTLRLFVNFFKVHHVYVFNSNNECQFGGYVGVIDTKALMQEIDFIKMNF